ncbi:MAG: hypothetical protein LBH84_05545 [Prevotellaceae bacterium]|nr:hypothetical protein [Prevotellaceae bacterium]
MNKVIFSAGVCTFAVALTACNKEDFSTNPSVEEQNIELRAATLGYPDAATYAENVAQQCASDNHENCDLLVNGSHRACTYADHAGINHDGTRHSGSDHHNASTCTDASHNHGGSNKGHHGSGHH